MLKIWQTWSSRLEFRKYTQLFFREECPILRKCQVCSGSHYLDSFFSAQPGNAEVSVTPPNFALGPLRPPRDPSAEDTSPARSWLWAARSGYLPRSCQKSQNVKVPQRGNLAQARGGVRRRSARTANKATVSVYQSCFSHSVLLENSLF